MNPPSSVLEARRLELERLFDRFQRVRFPPADGSELRNIHGLLVLYDADVAAAIGKILKTHQTPRNFRALSGLWEEDRLKTEIDILLTNYASDSAIGRTVREYASYYSAIQKVVAAARSYLDALDSDKSIDK